MAALFPPLALNLPQHLYPELGVELPEKHYGADCSLVTPEGAFNWKVGG